MTRWNWRPENTVLIDLETQSPVNLREMGSKVYLRCPHTRLLSLCAMRGREVLVWAPRGRYPGNALDLNPSELWPAGIARSNEVLYLDDGPGVPRMLLEWIASGATFVAHNAGGFDAEAYDRLIAKAFGSENPDSWCDSQPLAAASGLPRGLDALGQIFLGTGKDSGQDALKLLYTVKMKGTEPIYPVGTKPLWRNMLRYNVKDVLLLRRVYNEVSTAGEPELLDVHSRINNRGIYVDLGLLDTLLKLWDELIKDTYAELLRLTNGELTEGNLRSVPQVKAWLRKQGVQVDSLNRQILERLYDYPEEFFTETNDEHHAFICEVLRLRQAIVRISRSKLERIRQIADDDNRVRDVLLIYGAHTGRWAGRGIQPHNFARGVSGLDVEGLLEKQRSGKLSVEEVRKACNVLSPRPRADDALTTILRPVLRARPGATLGIADYAAIEGRGVAWVAGETGLLETFAQGRDVYCEMAGMIYGRPITKKDELERQVGKVTVLGCGYGMGAPKFTAYCKANKLDLAAAGTTAEACVEAYRDAYPKIAGVIQGKFRKGGIWRQYQAAARRAIERDAVVSCGKCRFFMDRGNLIVELPSGRRLTYRSASVQPRIPGYAAVLGLTMEPKPTIVYAHHHGYEGTLYGGLITENIVQAICRDLLAGALVNCGTHGLQTVMHVHDEIVIETESPEADLRDLVTIMSTEPNWAPGFPIAVEGFTCDYYVKKAFKNSHKAEARNGVLR